MLRPSHTAILISLEPVFAAITSWLLAREHLGGRVLLGAALILAGILLAELKGHAPDRARNRWNPLSATRSSNSQRMLTQVVRNLRSAGSIRMCVCSVGLRTAGFDVDANCGVRIWAIACGISRQQDRTSPDVSDFSLRTAEMCGSCTKVRPISSKPAQQTIATKWIDCE